jgi:hypothetical protein
VLQTTGSGLFTTGAEAGMVAPKRSTGVAWSTVPTARAGEVDGGVVGGAPGSPLAGATGTPGAALASAAGLPRESTPLTPTTPQRRVRREPRMSFISMCADEVLPESRSFWWQPLPDGVETPSEGVNGRISARVPSSNSWLARPGKASISPCQRHPFRSGSPATLSSPPARRATEPGKRRPCWSKRRNWGGGWAGDSAALPRTASTGWARPSACHLSSYSSIC